MTKTSDSPNPISLRPRWLVVDDETDLSELIADVLEDLGVATVENFTSSTDALATFSADTAAFDLVVTDRDMPELDGLEFARHIKAKAPWVKIILASANTTDLTADVLQHAGISAVVNKPFSLANLESTVRSTAQIPNTSRPLSRAA